MAQTTTPFLQHVVEKDRALQFQVCFPKLYGRFLFSNDIVSQSVHQLDTMYRVDVQKSD